MKPAAARDPVDVALGLLSRLGDERRCVLKDTTSGTVSVGGVLLCRARAAAGPHAACASIDFNCRCRTMDGWLAVGRALAAVEFSARSTSELSTTPDASAGAAAGDSVALVGGQGKARFGQLGRAWLQWSRDCGRSFEDVPVDPISAKRLHYVEEDGSPLETIPFVRYVQ